MKFIISIVISCFFLLSNAQFSPILKGKASCSRLLKSTTCIVLTEDEELNNELMKAFEEYWTITPILFIDMEQFAVDIIKPEYSFVHLAEYKVKGYKKEVGALGLLNGGYNDLTFYLNSTLAYISYDSWGIEKEAINLKYRIAPMVAQLNNTIQLIYDNNLTGKNQVEIATKLSKLYSEKSHVLKNKTLLIDKRYESTKIVSMQEFDKHYAYDFKVTGKTEIKEAIQSKDPNVAVLLSAYNLHKVNQVLDCSTYDVVYGELEIEDELDDYNLDKFDLDDIKQLSGTIKKSKAK